MDSGVCLELVHQLLGGVAEHVDFWIETVLGSSNQVLVVVGSCEGVAIASRSRRNEWERRDT